MLVSTVQHFLDLKADLKVVGKKDVSDYQISGW